MSTTEQLPCATSCLMSASNYLGANHDSGQMGLIKIISGVINPRQSPKSAVTLKLQWEAQGTPSHLAHENIRQVILYP